MAFLSRLFNSITLKQALLLAFIFRLLAVFFSPGFAFSDDHFEIIEIAQKWMDHQPITPPGEVYVFSLIYPAIHYLLFAFCQLIGIQSAVGMMFVVRLVHALYSMLTVYYGYKLTLRLCKNERIAIGVALLMGLFWMFPFMAVRNLREFVCIPPLMIAFYHACNPDLKLKHIIYAALFFVIAFVFRFQTIFFPLGVGMVWLFSKEQWKNALLFGAFSILFFFLTQGLFDTIYWGGPFASITAYIAYNAANSANYPNGPWFQYLLTVGGLLLLPGCFLFFIGYVQAAKKYKLVFVASLLFFIFHSYFPNKQERFIVPFLPFIMILGLIGYVEFYEANSTKKWVLRMTSILGAWFIIINTIALPVLSCTYTKRSRVEAMVYLKDRGDVRNFILDGDGEPPFPPMFYLGEQLSYYKMMSDKPLQALQEELAVATKPQPNYAVLCGNAKIEERLARLKQLFPAMQLQESIAPSLVDNIAYVVNPSHNVNETWYIYRLK